MHNHVGADQCVCPDEKNINNCKHSHEKNRANTQVRPYKSNLPEGWQIVSLKEVAGINPKIDKSTIADNTIVSFIPMQAVGAGDGRIDTSIKKHFADMKKGYTPFQPHDVLFAKITPCMENGKIAVVPALHNNLGFGSTEFHVIRPKDGVDPQYIYHYISRLDYRKEAASKMTGAVGQKRVPTDFIKSSTIPLAPLNEQLLIVAEIEKQFSRLDEAKAALKRIQANLKRYKASVLKAALEGKLTEQWKKQHPDVEPTSELLKRILTERRKKWEEDYIKKYVGGHGHAPKDDSWKKKYREPLPPDTTNLPKLPKGWVWASLDSICHQIGDVDHKMPKAKDSGIPYISTKDFLPAGEIDYESAKKIGQADYDKLCRKIFPENGDILLSRYGTVGEVRLVKTETLFQASYSIAILKPVSENMSDFLSLVLQTEPIQRQIKKHTRATAQPDLGLAHIRLLGVPIAPTDERKRIIEETDRLFSVTEEIEAIIQANTKRAERLRQSILKKAFSGRLV